MKAGECWAKDRGLSETSSHPNSPISASLGSTSPHWENSSAAGAGVLGDLRAQFTQSVFIQCSVWTESRGEVDAAEY